MGPIELLTIVLVVFVLAVKWFTQVHTNRLTEGLTVAENDEARFRGRYKKVEGEREAIAREIKALQATLSGIDDEVQELEEDLYEIDQRNSEIREQIENR